MGWGFGRGEGGKVKRKWPVLGSACMLCDTWHGSPLNMDGTLNDKNGCKSQARVHASCYALIRADYKQKHTTGKKEPR